MSTKDDNTRLIQILQEGLTVDQLAETFNMSSDTVRRRISAVAPVDVESYRKRYRLIDAAPYLVAPKIDIQNWLKKARKEDLPPALLKDVWQAALEWQKGLRQANMLFHVDDLTEMFSELFNLIKTTILLWPDMVERQMGLTPEQREKIIELADELQDNIYQALLDLGQKRKTLSSIKDLLKFADGDSPANYDMTKGFSEFELEDKQVLDQEVDDYV